MRADAVLKCDLISKFKLLVQAHGLITGGSAREPRSALISRFSIAALSLLLVFAAQTPAQAFTLSVQGCTQATPAVCTNLTGGFRYLVEEDNTTLNLPQTVQVVPPNGPSATLSIHRSHAPLVTSGTSAAASVTVDVPADKRYFVTVLPSAGYALGGASNFTIERSASWPTTSCTNAPNSGGTPAQVCFKNSVTVKVAQHPLPTAQITIFAHVDHNPINNTWDEYDGGLSGEAISNPPPLNGGLGGALVTITEAAGKQLTDVFGNPLGTRYGPDGTTVIQMGTGVISTMTVRDVNNPALNPDKLKVGEAIIKNLAPGKFGVTIVPPQFDDSGQPIGWIQTSTIEGTKTIDAWVKANEPRQFIEGFGQGFNHVAFGFVKVSPASESLIAGQSVKTLPWNLPPSDPDYVNRSAATGSIEGTVRLNHFSRPPNLQGNYPGPAVTTCWVGLNNPLATPGLQPTGLYVAPCDGNGHFVINNVPPGTYQLVYWDEPLQFLFGTSTVTVPVGSGLGAAVSLGDVLAFRWFGTLEGKVFFDTVQDGIRDAAEAGLPSQAVNLRFRDGSIYQATATDSLGNYKFAEVFPFFNWLITEVDFARFKATGMTTAIDFGGQITDLFAPVWPSNGNKTLQPQDPADPANANQSILYRTETGPVLLQAMQLFLGQTNLIDWGKANYGAGENGGVTGVVYYSVTRAEDNPRYGAPETWEPGIPRVQVCLYRDANNDGVIDDTNGVPGIQLCDIDNSPFGWSDGSAQKGPEDVARSGDGITFSPGDAIQVAATDSWDDNVPTGCIQTPLTLHGVEAPTCADGFGTWNQVRPGVFDGGYGFGTAAGALPGSPEYVPAGTYIVESAPPPNYSIVKEEDKNVMFGEAFTPSPLLLPPVCVGTVANGQPPHVVPPEYALFPGEAIPAPLAGSTTPLCNMKQVTVNAGQNTAADFHLLTEVPKAARVVGFVLNDLTAEFNAGSPVYGEKLAAKWIPVSFKDWTGRELTRVYADEWGTYNALLPSTFSINVPSPSGVGPSMITLVLNDPIRADGSPDPYYDPTYATSPWTLNYHPGKTTYADTPIVPIRAFAAAGTAFSTAAVTGTPMIKSVDHAGTTGTGALICTGGGNALPENIILTALGPTPVIDPVTGTTVTRDYGFGTAPGTVTLNRPGQAPLVLATPSWTNLSITAIVPSGATTGALVVTRSGAGGATSEIGVQLIISNCSNNSNSVRRVPSTAYPTIQSAIDAAARGNVIMVAPGTYNENVVMWKPVHLQGAGAGSTFINANPNPLDRLQAFHAKVDALGARDFAAYLLKDPFTAAEAPGIFVIGRLTYPNGTAQAELPGTKTLNPGTGNGNNASTSFSSAGEASIDGFTISGSKAGGGIFVVAGASNLVISNNNITSNQGNLAGGIGIGTPDVGFDSQNDNVVLRNNKVHANGGVDGSGGIAMNEGSQSYLVEGNLVTGNMSRFNGGGIAHNGFSLGNNVIRNNKILFNEVFFGALLNQAGDGGGIYVGDTVAGVDGTGNVSIERNLIQGNLTSAGSGAGIRAFAVNADDVRLSPANDATWSRLNIVNNIIANNVAGVAGGGISLQDVLRARIVNNTIVNNDSTATGILAFAAGSSDSTPQPAGIASAANSTVLQALITRAGEPNYSNPVLLNNVVWHNRSFFNDAGMNSGAGGIAPNPSAIEGYWDLGVINAVGTPPALNPVDTILSSLSGPYGENYSLNGSNFVADPGFVLGYVNTLATSTVIDEGGNNINVRLTPLDPTAGNYHLAAATSPAVNQGSNTPSGVVPTIDFDGSTRPLTVANPADIGADEWFLTSTGPTFPTLSVLDTFNRGNASTLGANWQQLVVLGNSGIRVNGNEAFCVNSGLAAALCSGGANAYWNQSGVFGTTQAAAFTFANTTLNNVSLVLKASSNYNALGYYPTAIRVRYSTAAGGQVIVETSTNGLTFTPQGTPLAGAFANGNTLSALTNAAGTVYVWRTSGATTTLLGQVALPTAGANAFTTGGGRIGMFLPPGARVNNFSGGDVAP